jgi:predicted membrane GTPase involved in stress response
MFHQLTKTPAHLLLLKFSIWATIISWDVLQFVEFYDGSIKDGQNIWVKDINGKSFSGKVTKLFTFNGKKRVETKIAESGDIVTVCWCAGH